MEASISYAKQYLENLLSFYGLNIDVHATHEEDVIRLSVPSTHLNAFLIGQHGDNMRAMQYTLSMALRAQNYEVTRVNIDIADYKAQREERLAEKAQEWIAQVKKTGEPKTLPPMNAADRRIVHKVAGDSGLRTESAGEGRDRHVVLYPVDSEEA